MAVINFSKADVLRSQNLENEHWYSWKIVGVKGPTPSKDKQSLNYVVTFSLIDTASDIDGKEVTRTYNSKAISMFIPLIAAVRGVSMDTIPKEAFALDTDELKGKTVDGKYTLELFEGQLIGRCESYLPYKSASSATPGY